MPQSPGHVALLIRRQRVRDAVDDLFHNLETTQLRKLKIRAGEHLATIVTTAFLGTAPRADDLDGGPDLEFDVSDEPPDRLRLAHGDALPD